MEKIKVKNLAHLKRLMQIGTVFCTPVHNNHPKYIELVRVYLLFVLWQTSQCDICI